MGEFSGKTAIVTGASTLIGQAVVTAFEDAGANVVMADIDAEAGQAFADSRSDRVVFAATNVTSDADIDACIATAVNTFGGLDFLVNIASTYLDDGLATTRENWLAGLNINLVGGVIFTQKAVVEMRKRGGGAVVNYASISGKVSQPGRMVYSASKAAILNATKCEAHALAGDNIRVNSVSPGWTWSNIMRDLSGDDRAKVDGIAAPFHISGRTGNPEEVANAALFLCSEKASFINGTDLAVDGGYSALGPECKVNAVEKMMQ